MSNYASTSASSGGNVATNETGDLIAAGKVEGTTVYDRSGQKIGSIYDVMIDKRSGQVAYAVLSFGGFLGVGENYNPLPWNQLTYDTQQGGYVVDMTEDRLKGAPTYAQDQDFDADYRRQVDDYYGAAGEPMGMGASGMTRP